MSDSTPFDLLKDELSNDDTQIKVNAIHRLQIVMAYMTSDKLISDLIPFINKLVSTEEDEVLLAIAENLSKFRIYLKDDKFVNTFPLYQTLLCTEETVVRDTAVESIREIIKTLPEDLIYNHILPIIYNISNQENFTGKISACYMIRMVYQKSGKDKEKLRNLYFKLCDEDVPLIKRAAAKEFGHLCIVMEKEVVNPDMINYFKKFMNESDSIRVLMLSSLVILVKLFQNTELQRINVQVVVAASDDKSWRVRHELAKIFPSLIEGFGSQINELVPTFANLIKDSETEVKLAALEGLCEFIKNISSEKVSVCIIPVILSLNNENSPHVKSLIGESLGSIAKSVGYSQFSSKLGATFESLCKDENADVKLGAIKSIYEIIVSSEGSAVSSYYSLFNLLLKDTQYKIRENIIVTSARLGIMYGLDYFKEKLEGIYLCYLVDFVAAVREQGVVYAEILGSKFGPTWITNSLIAKLLNYLNQTKTFYLIRIIALSSIAVNAKHLNGNQINEHILPHLVKHLKDKIPNVRFHVLKLFINILPYTDNTGKEKIKSSVKELKNDEDIDVKYFVNKIIS